MIITEANGAVSVYAVDVDGDGNVDVLSASEAGGITWYQNRLAGDANDNGEVDFGDFLKLAANFGSTEAAWEDGDFDGNGRIEFADFLILAENFGKSRQPVVAPSLLATSQAAETLSAVTISAADDLFERFDDELSLDNLV